MHRLERFRRCALPAVMLLLGMCILYTMRGHTWEEILQYQPQNPLAVILVLTGLYTLKSAVCAIPMTALYLSAGVLFPPLWAVAVTYLGLVLEITTGYWIGRVLGKEGTAALAGKSRRAAGWLRSLDRNSDFVVCVVRIVPGPLPFDMMSWLFGASDLRFSRYLFFSLLGVSPAMLPWVLAGNAIAEPLSAAFLIPFAVGAAIAFAALVILRRWNTHGTP